MRWLLLTLCACNRLLGVTGTVIETDARPGDGLPDAQPYCPTMTGVVPRYSPVLHEIIDQYCVGYQTSATLAIGQCQSPTAGLVVSQGPIDMPLHEITGLPALSSGHIWQNPRISPEGDVLYLDDFDSATFTAVYHTFARQADDSWLPGPTLPFTSYGFATLPSRAPQRHVLFFGASAQIDEWAQDANDAWQPVRSFDPGAASRAIWFAPDGLRAVVVVMSNATTRTALLFDRATIDDAFGTPQPVPTLPAADDLFINADCTRAYMSGADSVFYAQQI